LEKSSALVKSKYDFFASEVVH